MSYIEAKRKINEIKESTSSFQNEVNKVQSQLMELSSEINKVSTSIANDLHEDTIASFSSGAANNINSKINEALVKSSSALSGLSTDATGEIKRIVDEHNASIDYESDNPEPKLEYETISLSSVVGCPEEADEPVSEHRPTYPSGGGLSVSQEINLDYYLNMLSSTEFNSSDIEGWDDYVQKFLREYNLDKAIKDIKVEGKKVTCILSNGKEYEFTDITSTLDLLKALQAAIAKEEQSK